MIFLQSYFHIVCKEVWGVMSQHDCPVMSQHVYAKQAHAEAEAATELLSKAEAATKQLADQVFFRILFQSCLKISLSPYFPKNNADSYGAYLPEEASYRNFDKPIAFLSCRSIYGIGLLGLGLRP